MIEVNALLTITVRISGTAAADAAKIKASLGDLKSAAASAGSAVAGASGGSAAVSAANASSGAFGGLFSTLRSGVGTAGNALSSFSSGLSKVFTSLTNTGQLFQRVGRSLTTTFTVPVLAAGGAALDFALKQSQAFAQLQANYGGVGQSAASTASDLGLLDQAFTELSDTYGISKVTLDGIATQYAKAGAAGAQLAQDVQNVAQVMVISGDSQTDVTDQLIGLQEAYHLSASQMQSAIEQMVVVTKDAPVTFDDLTEAMRTSAGAAAESGIPISELADLVTALAPAAGGASTAGNALRTVISRLADPSKDYVSLLNMMGINTNTVAWQSDSATTKLLIMAQAMNGLTNAQKAAVDATASSRFQIDRFSVLIGDLANPLGNYAKSLNDTSNKQQVFSQYSKELQTVLSSNSQTFQILWQQLQNALVQIIVPLLPALESLVGTIARLAQAFSNLSPQTQQFILLGALMLAVAGPILRYVASVAELIGVFGRLALAPLNAVAWLLKYNDEIGSVFAWPFQELGNVMEGAFNAGASGVKLMWNGLTSLISTLAGWVSSVYTSLAAWVAGWGAADGVIVTENVAAAGDTAATWVAADGAIITDTAITAASVVAIWAATPELIAGAMAALPELMEAAVIAPTVEEVGALADAFPDAIEAAAREIPAIAGEVVDGLGSVFTGLLSSLGELFSGAWGSLSGFLLEMLEALGEVAAGIASLFGPDEIALIVAAIAALGFLIYSFFDGDLQTWISSFATWLVNTFSSAWNALPGIVEAALNGVVQVLEGAVDGIKDLLSYLDPFAHHSPSLVDNVQDGLNVVAGEYGNLTGAGGVYEQAQSAHDTFTAATSPAPSQATQRSQIVKADGAGAGTAYDAQIAAMTRLQGVLTTLTADYTKQDAVVVGLKTALDASQASLTAAQSSLSGLQAAASATSTALSDAKSNLSNLLNTPITGMTAMSDKIFANTEAQKQLQLQMDQLQDINGVYVNLTQAAADYQGELQSLTAKQTTLREQGAGSDVLGPLTNQISALQGQQLDVSSRVNQINDLNNQLTSLQHTGDELTLEQSIMFDPLTKQLQDASAAINEVPFPTLLKEVQDAKKSVDTLTTTYNTQNAAVLAQQKVVDALTASHSALQTSYDAENQKLSDLASAYTNVSSQIQQMQSDLNSAASSAAAAKPDQAEQNFDTGALDTNPGAFGTGDLPTGGDLSALVAQWAKQAQQGFGNLDIFGPLKDKLTAFKKWFKDQLNPASFIGAGTGAAIGAVVLGPIGAVVGALLGLIIGDITGHFLPQIEAALESAWRTAIQFLDGIWQDIWKPITGAWNATMGAITGAFKSAWSAVSSAANTVWSDVLRPVFDGIMTALNYSLIPAVHGLATAFSTVWNDVVAPVVQVAWAIIKPIFDIMLWIFQNVLPPVLEAFGEIFQIVFFGLKDLLVAAWNNTIYPVLKALWTFISQDLGPVLLWLLNNIVIPVFGGIGSLIAGTWNHVISPVFSALVSFVKNVLAPTFEWLWSSVISPVFSVIGTVIQAAWNNVIHPALKAIDDFFHTVLAPTFIWFRDTIIKPVMDGIGSAISTVWDGILKAINFAIDRAIDIFNAIGGAINTIGSLIPGVTIRVSKISYPTIGTSVPGIPKAATGAVLASEVGAGFKTGGPRAIVGEGNPHYPEYVIPTDPGYRANALRLMASFMSDVGIPKHKQGGVLGTAESLGGDVLGGIGDVFGSVSSITTSLGSSLAGAIGSGLSDLVDLGEKIASAGFDAATTPIKAGLDKLIGLSPEPDWAKSIEKGVITDAFSQLKSLFPGGGKPGGGLGEGAGGTVPAAAHLVAIQDAFRIAGIPDTAANEAAVNIIVTHESGWDPTAINKTDINAQHGNPSEGLMQTTLSTFAAWEWPGYTNIYDPISNIIAGSRYAVSRYGSLENVPGVESINSGGPYKPYATGGVLPLGVYDSGGLLPTGLSFAFNGTGAPEKVLTNEQSSSGSRTFNFYGDLSFPNITDEDDAEAFIKNLEALA